ncbi:MAG: CDP-alcohol phosphatidyltransferase family protein [Christensenellaceae bacterium]|jgi:cardiolipin synthase|nr:CDP-alcohol phosphatidyltransferase family protein [Christensenellaceae bacterium]
MKNIPNILSATRLALVGVFVYYFVRHNYTSCIVTYAIAFLLDILDGFLARRYGWESDVGKILDPLADKLLLLTALVCFAKQGWLPWYIPIAMAAKELCMLIGGLFMLGKKNVVVSADRYGKFAAGFFNVSVLLMLLSYLPGFEGLSNFTIPLFLVAILCAFITLVHYARTQVFGAGIHAKQEHE